MKPIDYTPQIPVGETRELMPWEAVEHFGWRLPSCSSDACDQGRKPCPTPAACQVPEDVWEFLSPWETRLFFAAVLLDCTAFGSLVWIAADALKSI